MIGTEKYTEVTWTQKDKLSIFSLIVVTSSESLDVSI